MNSREYKKLKIATPPFASHWLFRLFCKHEFVIHRLDKELFEDKSLYVTCNRCGEQYICNEFFNNEKLKVMNKINEAGYNEAPKFGPSQNNPPYISDDFQIGPNGAYEHNETIKIQQELIDVLYSQVIDLTMMSKIELGDDVIAEIKRLKQLINEQTG